MYRKATTLAASAILLCVGVQGDALAGQWNKKHWKKPFVSVEGVREHQAAFQEAADNNGGTREASSPGYMASVDYVVETMEAAGYDVTIQEFAYPFFQEQEPAVLEQTAPTPTVYNYFQLDGFATMEYSGNGDVTALTEAVDLQLPPNPVADSSTSGCEASDFVGFTPGKIAIIQRGSCSFAQKAANAKAAGAAGVVIFNEGQPGRTDAFVGTLGAPGISIPVVGAAFSVGEDLAAGVTAHLKVNATSEIRMSKNVIADTPAWPHGKKGNNKHGGPDRRVVLVGAHLDSVPGGPGIQDNGSGSAALLEIAQQMKKYRIKTRRPVRFAWWGAEESGLLGSIHYVSQLTAEEAANIALNLNFDMIGSPNFVRFIYDGDGSDTGTAGPAGSELIEREFQKYFKRKHLETEPTAFDGRSDYGPFIAVGIPAGGLFTGAEGIKSDEEAAIYGGVAGDQYDPCYHLACDTFDNISLEALGQMSNAAAYAVLRFSTTRAYGNKLDRARAELAKVAVTSLDDMPYRGPHLQR